MISASIQSLEDLVARGSPGSSRVPFSVVAKQPQSSRGCFALTFVVATRFVRVGLYVRPVVKYQTFCWLPLAEGS
jgi:hypothetical protein